MKPPSKVTARENDYNTYVLALEDVITWQMIDKEDALAVTASVTPAPYPITAPNPPMTDIKDKMKKEMATLIVMVMAAATITNGGSGGGGSSGSGHRRKPAYGKDKNGNNLPRCPHCNKPAMHKPDNCFSLPNNGEKMKTANFVDGKFVKKIE